MSSDAKPIVAAPILAAKVNHVHSDAESLRQWPTLMSLLYPVWKDGQCVRQSGSLSLSLVGGFLIVTVRCPTEQLETRITLDSLTDFVDRIELAVSDASQVWLPTFAAQKKARRAVIDTVTMP